MGFDPIGTILGARARLSYLHVEKCFSQPVRPFVGAFPGGRGCETGKWERAKTRRPCEGWRDFSG
jgi:hypothetical protein